MSQSLTIEVSENDVLLNITGDSVARSCQVDNNILPARVNQHVAIIRPDPRLLWPRFLRYYLVSPAMQADMLSFAGAGATRNARDTGLPKEIAELFPDEFVPACRDVSGAGRESELGDASASLGTRIPEGWRIGSVDDEFDLTMGQSPPGETYNEIGDGLPFYQGRTDFGVRFPSHRVFCTVLTRFASAGDTLISVRAPVGDINMATERCAIGRGVAAARHKSGSRSYSYQFMQSINTVFARFEAEGTVFGSIGKKDFHAIPCVIPPRDLVFAFERQLSPIDNRIEVNDRESRTLIAMRDTLLPNLISGEVRIKDAERFCEATL